MSHRKEKLPIFNNIRKKNFDVRCLKIYIYTVEDRLSGMSGTCPAPDKQFSGF
jgi:hypothetical protein